MGFRKDFLWGGVTAANQCEGGFKGGGRGPANVDICPREEDRRSVISGKSGNLQCDDCHEYPSHDAIDLYHHYRKDVRLFGEMCFRIYRMSIA